MNETELLPRGLFSVQFFPERLKKKHTAKDRLRRSLTFQNFFTPSQLRAGSANYG